MKNKKTTWVFLYIKYSKFWSISLEHFIERKPLIYEEWQLGSYSADYVIKHLFIILADGKNCKTCDRILAVFETKTVELEDAGIKVVRINDKKSAKAFGILSSPGLTYFKGGKGDNFEGELTDGKEKDYKKNFFFVKSKY